MDEVSELSDVLPEKSQQHWILLAGALRIVVRLSDLHMAITVTCVRGMRGFDAVGYLVLRERQ
jgi:hypothetical protein